MKQELKGNGEMRINIAVKVKDEGVAWRGGMILVNATPCLSPRPAFWYSYYSRLCTKCGELPRATGWNPPLFASPEAALCLPVCLHHSHRSYSYVPEINVLNTTFD